MKDGMSDGLSRVAAACLCPLLSPVTTIIPLQSWLYYIFLETQTQRNCTYSGPLMVSTGTQCRLLKPPSTKNTEPEQSINDSEDDQTDTDVTDSEYVPDEVSSDTDIER